MMLLWAYNLTPYIALNIALCCHEGQEVTTNRSKL
jgi:hypothetical protein